MKTINLNLKKKINILLSLASLLVLYYDGLYTNEFNIESPYAIIFTGLMIFNITMQLSSKARNQTFVKIISTAIIVLCTVNFYFLFILSFGVVFTGRSYPTIMIISVLFNIGLIFFAFSEFALQKNELNKDS